MLISKRAKICLAIAACVSSLSVTSSSRAAGGILYYVNEMPKLAVVRILLEGRVERRAVSASIELQSPEEKALLVTRVFENGQEIGSLELPADNLPAMDLTSADIYADRNDEGTKILIDIRGGIPRDCFINDDGRDRLTLIFSEKKKPIAYLMSYNDCKKSVKDF